MWLKTYFNDSVNAKYLSFAIGGEYKVVKINGKADWCVTKE